jgi:hypothetical protein
MHVLTCRVRLYGMHVLTCHVRLQGPSSICSTIIMTKSETLLCCCL